MTPVASLQTDQIGVAAPAPGNDPMTGSTLDHKWAVQLSAVGERGSGYGRCLTPRRLALDAARLMLQQDLWGRATSSNRVVGKLTLLGSLCVAAGGNYTEDGLPAPPDEPEAAAVLEKTCELLAENLAGGQRDAKKRLDSLCPESPHDSLDVQKLLATVHGVPPSVSV
jgi:hypothetical protein